MIISLLWNQRRWKKKLKVLKPLNRHTVYPAGGSSLKTEIGLNYMVIRSLILCLYCSCIFQKSSGSIHTNCLQDRKMQRVLTNLLKEGIPIRDLETIVENLMQTASETGLPPRELDQTVEKIRTALKRTITRMYCTDGCMKVITLDAQLEREMVASLSKGENGLYLALNPEMLQHVIRQLAEQIKKFSGLSQNPVILTSQVMRIHFYHLVEPFYPNIRVLSFNEIANNVQIQSIGNISTMKKGS